MKYSTREKLFSLCNIILLGVIALSCLYPFIYVLSISLSTAAEASRDGFHLYPREISLTSYKMVLSNPNILTGFTNSVIRTVLGTVLTLFATCIAAYPLSRKEMPFRSMIVFFILFTMLFNGGMVTRYILIEKLGLLNTMGALILPMLLTAFNIVIMKNFFQAIPDSFAEAARMEGASEWHILFKVYIPLSKPVLATVALWTMVTHWNSWFDAMLYITDDSKQVLQTFLQRIVVENSTKMMEIGLTDTSIVEFTQDTVKAATVIVTVLPIVCIYPFMQKYFTKGIMLGGIKE
jgi:putative aldouronate transport system permease protein